MSESQLIEAVKAGDLAAVEGMIESGVDVNQQDEQGWTPLNWAAGGGKLEIVKLLVKHRADVFKVGRDMRTPYMIALAAGRAEVVKFLREAEDQVEGEKPTRPERKYCKAYHLSDFRQFPNWTESKINWKEKDDDGAASKRGRDESVLSGDQVVFIHQDYTVTESMWHNENVIFNQVTPEWVEFCTTSLKFKVPDDLDLIASATSASQGDGSADARTSATN